jgi:Macrophage migration inhibitory factor (MIF)
MTITALPSQVQPVTNKRNTMLLQKQLEESLGVSPSRGIIKFVGIAEENFAFNGKTFAGEIEELEREQADNNTNLARSLSRGAPKVGKKRHSMRSLKSLKISSGGAGKDVMPMPSPVKAEATPPLSDRDTPTPTLNMIPVPAIPAKSDMDKRAEKAQKLGRRKSFIQGLFGRG